ncbi:MAG: sodium-dependent bicarbonate transport family permease [Actinomycetes bacterium]
MGAAAGNLISPGVLFFALGAFAAAVKADIAFPKQIAQTLAIYLMAAIGFKGGAQLRKSGLEVEAFLALGGGLILGVTLPLIAFAILSRLKKVERVDAASIAAHYGSVSLVTFGAALAFFEEVGEPTSGYMPAVLALMEAPAIAIGVMLARRGSEGAAGGLNALKEALTTSSVLILLGATVIGILLGAEGLDDLNGFFIAPFAGVLAFFLLDMGALAFSRIGALRQAGPQLIAFALVMPLISGSIGTIVGTALGMQVGDVALLATLAASASYIAAPAAMRVAVPEANPGISLPLVLAVTFPFNLILGIPLYLEMARMLGG